MTTTPSSTEREQRLECILADYLHAVEAGTPPDRAEMLARHPDLAADLASFFQNRDAMERMARPIKQQLPGRRLLTRPECGAAVSALWCDTLGTMSCSMKLPVGAWGWCTGRDRCRWTALWP